MAGESWFLWIGCGYVAEGRLWLERLLDKYDDKTAARATALGTTAFIAAVQGNGDRGKAAADEAWELARSLGDELRIAYAVHMRALCAFVSDDLPQAERLYVEAGERYEVLRVSESLSLSLLFQYATIEALRGDLPTSEDLFKVIECRAQEVGEKWLLSWAGWGLGLVSFLRGNLDDAENRVLQSIAAKRSFHDGPGLSLAFDVLAWIRADRGSAAGAATMIGAASRTWSTVGVELFGAASLSGQRQRCEATVHAALGESAFDAAFAHGAARSLDETLAYLLHEDTRVKGLPREQSGLLTRREREVAELLAGGLSNREIADRLVISVRTCHGHVENILRKLGFRSRTQVATWFLSAGVDATEKR